MTEKFIYLAIKNILLIYNSTTESLPLKDFVCKDEDERSELITILTLYDFIETDNEEDVYFLTTETYNLIEEEELQTKIWSFYSGESKDQLQFSMELSKEEEEKLVLEAEVLKNQKWLTYCILLTSLIILGTVKYYSNRKTKLSKSELEIVIGEEMINNIKTKSDSILQSTDMKSN